MPRVNSTSSSSSSSSSPKKYNNNRHWTFNKKVTEETIYLSRNLKEFEKIILQQILNEEISPKQHPEKKQLEFLRNVIYVEKNIEKQRSTHDKLQKMMTE